MNKPYLKTLNPYQRFSEFLGYLLQENGFFLLQENGFKIILEGKDNPYGKKDKPFRKKTSPYSKKLTPYYG